MAGEIAQDTAIMIALSSAAIGAGGAVVAQIVAGLITGTREQRTANAEAERWKLEAEGKRRDRQLDHKTELFSKFMAAMEESCLAVDPLGGRPPKGSETLIPARQLRVMSLEIGILAPELNWYASSCAGRAAMLWGVLRDNSDSAGTSGEIEPLLEENRASILFWANSFLEATQAYVNHEVIKPHEDVVIDHDNHVKDSLQRLRAGRLP